jgi:hypothetical protein
LLEVKTRHEPRRACGSDRGAEVSRSVRLPIQYRRLPHPGAGLLTTKPFIYVCSIVDEDIL